VIGSIFFKGVPQRPMLGTFTYNVFVLYVQNTNDDTIGCCGNSVTDVVKNLKMYLLRL
jgi:hypothetical protein